MVDEKDRRKRIRLQRHKKQMELNKQCSKDVSVEAPAFNRNFVRSDVAVTHNISSHSMKGSGSSDVTTDRRRSYFAYSKLATKFGKSSLHKTISGEDEEKDDFYLYRQPHLNKSIWETKPRPYR
jgi:DNA-binding PucR family transcriptional regulator